MKNYLGIFVLSVLGAALAWGQATAQIHGVVQDMSGAAIPGAVVKATQTETGISRTVNSETNGEYVLSNLPLGPYRVEVSKEGFATAVQVGIVLQVNADPAIPIAMKVGAVSEQVSVEANASQVETSSEGVGSVIENQRVLDLPLNGRRPEDLIALGGAAVVTGSSPSFGMRTGYVISVAGGNTNGVQYVLDGANHDNFFDGTSMPLPMPDSLQEFKIATSTQDAGNSGRAGATVSAVMKSGTNSFHGDLFEFLRNSDVNARDFFAKTQDGLKRNQFGGVFGGPIKKDKMFFFLGYQGTFTRQNPVQAPTFVPTPAMLAGNFQTITSAACQGHLVTLPAPFVNNMINPTLFDPAAVKIAALLPQPTNPNGCGGFTYTQPLSEDDHEVDSRVDYQLSDRQSLFARYMLSKQIIAVPYSLAPSDVLTAGGVGANDQFQGFTIGDTFLVSATKVNSARLYLNRISAIIPGAHMFGPENVGINAYTYQPNYLTIPVSGAFSLGSGNFSENSFAYTTAFGFNDDFRIVHGSHQFAFGGFITRSIEWSVAQAWSGGSYTIGNTTGLGLADFMLGIVSQDRQANPNPLNLAQNFVGLYAQDTWKITNKLTLNYGLNWDPFLGMNFQQGDVYNFSLANYYAGTTSKVVAGAPPGFTFPGDSGFPGKSGINSQYGHFDPRVGLAWDPIGDGKTAIRVGGGIAHDFIAQDLNLNTSSSLPFRLTTITTPTSLYSLSNPFPQGDPFPYNFNPKNPVWPTTATAPCLTSTCPPGFLPIPSNLATHVEYSWNLGVQRQITQSWFASATYVGNHIIHVWDAVELNPGVYIPGNCSAGQYGLTAAQVAKNPACTQAGNLTARRALNLANPTANPLGYLTQYDDGGTQGYNGLLLNSTWRLRGGLSVNGNYTWSHCIGVPFSGLLNDGANYIHSGFGNNIPGSNNRDADVGNCVQDRRQIANVTLVYQTPKYSNQAMRVVATGWTLGSTIQARSGAFLTPVTAVTPDPTTGFGGNQPGTQRPNQIAPNIYTVTQGASCTSAPCEQWFSPQAFGAVPIGTYGNMGVGSILGPGFWQWDMSLSRQFRIVEGQNILIRFEGFNVTNSFRPGNPGVAVGAASTFGLITTDATPGAGVAGGSPSNAPARVFQIAMKYVF